MTDFDREKARAVLVASERFQWPYNSELNRVLDALAACVVEAAPADRWDTVTDADGRVTEIPPVGHPLMQTPTVGWPRPTTPDIDRDALLAIVSNLYSVDSEGDLEPLDAEPLADRILALVRPAAGITLTPDEQQLLAPLIRSAADTATSAYPAQRDRAARLTAIADRLEAAS